MTSNLLREAKCMDEVIDAPEADPDLWDLIQALARSGMDDPPGADDTPAHDHDPRINR